MFCIPNALTARAESAHCSGADGSVTSDTTRAYIGEGAEDVRLVFADQGTEPTFASFTLNVLSLPSSGSEYSFGFIDGATMDARFGISVTGGGTSYVMTAYGGGSAIVDTDDTDLFLNTDYTITIFSDGTNSHRLWVDANTGSFDFPDLQATGNSSDLDGFFVRQAGSLDGGASSWTIADLVVGTEFTDVVSGPPVITTNVRFSIAADQVDETNGTYDVTIEKNLPEGNISGEIALGGTATEGDDYTINTTNFTLNGAVTSATFTITIIDDPDFELNEETVTLSFANLAGGIAAAPSTFTLTIVNDDAPPTPPNGPVWINEINYDEPGTETNEFVEIAGPAGLDLSVYSLFVYNGANGAVLSSNQLTGTIDDEGCGYGAVAFALASDLQNGPDGVALVSNGVTVIQFLSYEGSFQATEGPALGYTSVDIGVSQSGSEDTVQLTGTGSAYDDFVWTNDVESIDALNAGQTIDPCNGGGTVIDPYDITDFVIATNTVTVTAAGASNGIPYTLYYTTNLLTDPPPFGTGIADTDDTATLEDTFPDDDVRLYWMRTNDDLLVP
jgi:hypothetical protein